MTKKFFSELKRRRVYTVAIVYGAVAIGIVQVADVVLPALQLPAWTITLVVVLTLLGFPIALVLAWIFDLGATGVTRTGDVESQPPPASPSTARTSSARAAGLLGLGIIVALVGFGVSSRYLIDDGVTDKAASADSAALDSEDRQSIAVLPFANLSPDPANAFFADGVTEDILTALAKIGDFRVISRTSVMQYKGTQKPLRVIASELGVRTVLEGSVTRDGDRVRIVAQLINASSDEHIWAESYDRRLNDIFAIRSEIAQHIATALQAQLTTADKQQLARRPTQNVQAYDLYVQARIAFLKESREEVESAIRLLKRALELDPQFADAIALLGWAYAYRTFQMAERNWADSAVAAGQRALSLVPDLAEGWTAVGLGNEAGNKMEAALAAYQRAVELNPNLTFAIAGVGVIHGMLGRHDEEVIWLRRAVAVEPRAALNLKYLGDAYSSINEFELARQSYQRALELQPDYLAPLSGLANLEDALGSPTALEAARAAFKSSGDSRRAEQIGDVFLNLGQLDSAHTYYTIAETNRPGTTNADIGLAWIARQRGDTARMRAMLERARQRVRNDSEGGESNEDITELARIAMVEGQTETALRELERAYAAGARYINTFLQDDPIFQPVRDHPRFRSLVQRTEADLARMRERVRNTSK